jgi:hypothetical protein
MHFRLTLALLLGILITVSCFEIRAQAATDASPTSFENVQHAYGLPGTKPNDRGTLTITSEGLAFVGKTGQFTIQRPYVTGVSTGNERVELWGMKGRMLRMAIPNGGGLAAAGVMHHRVDMLTVEFTDERGGYHAAVFFMPANDATRAAENFSPIPTSGQEVRDTTCQGSSIWPRSVLVSTPQWNQIDVPAAYRALVYEHFIDTVRHVEGVGDVYREGETAGAGVCPEFTIQLSIESFKQGSQIQRAMTGPVGFFLGTTQIAIRETIRDVSGQQHAEEQVKATIRGESESKNVAKGLAKNLAKRYAEVQKQFEKDTIVNRGTP